MKLNGALKPRQGASKPGSSPGVVLKKYRDKRYYKLNENVANGLSRNKCGPCYTGRKQFIVNNSKNNFNNKINIIRQTQTQSQQTLIQTQHENNSSIRSLNTETKRLKTGRNRATVYKITQTITTAIRESFSCIDSNSNEECSDIKAVILAKEEEKQKNTNNNKNKNNITTRQVEYNKRNKNCYDNNNSHVKSNKNYNNERNERKQKQTKQVQVVKTTRIFLKKQYVNVNKTNKKSNNNNNTSNKNNNSDLIYSMEQQQPQEQLVVNKFLSIGKIYENLVLCALIILAAIISRFLKQLKLLLFFMYSHAIKHLDVGYPIDRSGRAGIGNQKRKSLVVAHGFRLVKIMRASQTLKEPFVHTSFKNVNKSRLNPTIALCMVVCAAVTILLPQPVVGDDGDNFFPINGIETTTPEFDYASRGQKKFGDKCENTLECGFPGSICDPKKKSCQCTEDLPVTNHIDKCGKEAAVNESCFFNEQCEVKYFQTECRDQRCVCRFDMTPVWLKDGTVECKGRGDKKGPETYIDPAMIGVLIGMALMFIIICVVLRLFSQARWRENRTIFNTPNPRLMNVSLLRESKLLHGQERRGSRMSVRVPSRQPSMASLRPHSPNPSLGSRSNSHGSNASATSLRSTRSNSVSPAGITVNNSHHERKGSTYQPHHHSQQTTAHPQHQHQHQQQQQQEQQPLTQTNIISNPVAETVTVEIIEPEK